jgi:colanic acid/amylovoran biosynthesis glycosyltransferase
LKIAYFVNHYPKVSHSFIRREILALERRGFEVQRIALHGWNDPLPDPEDQAELGKTRYVLRQGVLGLLFPTARILLTSPVRLLKALRKAWQMSGSSERAWPYHLAYLAEACRILPWLQSAGARHVHAHFGGNSAEVVMYARMLGGPPYSFTVHGPAEFQAPMGLGAKVHDAAFAVAISSFGRSQLYLHCAYEDWAKIKVVHCGLERSFIEGADAVTGASRRLICVGRLCREKGQLLLIEAMARLRDQGISCELLLAGDGPMRSECERLIADYGLTQQVRISGWISSAEVMQEILASRALVLPTFDEGLPVVLMEALALCRPVVTTYVAGIPELVRAGESGWMIPAGSIEELTEALEACLAAAPEDLRRMGEAGRERVRARHAIDTEAQKLIELFSASHSSA